jgi:hypothetical protein
LLHKRAKPIHPPYVHPSAHLSTHSSTHHSTHPSLRNQPFNPLSMEQMIADEIVSIASSAAAMEREALEKRVVELETQLLRASAQRTAARAATAAELRNQAIHDRSLAGTAGIATAITTMDTYTLWWLSQWDEWRKTRIAENGDPAVAAHVRSYKEWVRTTGARVAAGMGGDSVPKTPGGGFVPQTPE